MSRELRWGIIGCGDVVEKKSGPSILQAGAGRIVGVMRRDAEKARPFAEANDIPLCTNDPDAILNHPDVDIVYVATPPVAHQEFVLDAAAAGKHVLVEKPMGMNTAEDDEMIAACDAAGVELFVSYYRRFQPHVLKMKELIAAGSIGRVVCGQIDFAIPPLCDYDWAWRTDPAVSGGGLFVDVVTHRIDLMVDLLGEPLAASGHCSTFPDEKPFQDLKTMSVFFESGRQCSIVGDFASQRFSDRFVVAGTGGVISTEHLDGQAFALTVGESRREFRFDKFPAPHLGLMRHIQRVLLEGEPNGCSGRDGRFTDRILDWTLRTPTL